MKKTNQSEKYPREILETKSVTFYIGWLKNKLQMPT